MWERAKTKVKQIEEYEDIEETEKRSYCMIQPYSSENSHSTKTALLCLTGCESVIQCTGLHIGTPRHSVGELSF